MIILNHTGQLIIFIKESGVYVSLVNLPKSVSNLVSFKDTSTDRRYGKRELKLEPRTAQ